MRVVIRVDFNGDVGEGNRDDEEVLVEAKEIRMMHTGSGESYQMTGKVQLKL